MGAIGLPTPRQEIPLFFFWVKCSTKGNNILAPMNAHVKGQVHSQSTGHGSEVVRRAVPRSARKVSKMALKFLV